MCEKDGTEIISFRSNIYKSLDYKSLRMIKLNFELTLKNCAHYGTLESAKVDYLFDRFTGIRLSIQIDQIVVAR